MRANDNIPEDERLFAQQIADQELRNAAFRELAPAARRVAIARDVIVQIERGEIKAKAGDYVSTYGYDDDGEMVDLPACEACAIGSMFMCGLFDRGTEDVDHTSSRFMVEKLSQAAGFSEEQLRMMEAAFEGDQITGLLDYEVVNKCAVFGRGTRSDKERLIAIMQNVVDNEGTFIP